MEIKNRQRKSVRREILVRLSTEGRITIPPHVQELYDLKKGDLLEMILTGILKNDGKKEDAQNEGNIDHA